MGGMNHKALVFDFFGVVCSEVSTFWLQNHFPGHAAELRAELVLPADRGATSQDALMQELGTRSGVSPAQVLRDWVGRSQLNEELLEFIRELKGSYKLGLLSNATAPFFHTVAKPIEDEGIFEHIVISSEVGYAKPDPQMYHLMLEKLGVRPEEALMIDDNKVNIEGAARIGMPGIVFTSVAELRRALRG